MIETLKWDPNEERLILLDQTKLPQETIYRPLKTLDEVIEAIQALRVRGAPAIGVSAAYGLVITARGINQTDFEGYMAALREKADRLKAARPTAVNLQWAVESIMGRLQQMDLHAVENIPGVILKMAIELHEDDRQRCELMAEQGQSILPPKARVLTHCNTGFLATAGMGTALGVVIRGHERGMIERVYADETRPLLQGARLTAWECQQLGIPCTIICDNMAGALMKQGAVDLVMVGADRIAGDGSAANKVGTYGLAVLARAHRLPFYVVAPFSTFDSRLPSGDLIPIEHRNPEEVLRVMGRCSVAPDQAEAWNPAFDVTPPELITGIITEQGILKPPFDVAITTLAKLQPGI